MTNVCILSESPELAITFFRNLIRLTNQDDCVLTLVKSDLGGLQNETIHPLRLVFRDETTRRGHTFFCSVGNLESPRVRMGLMTLTRICTEVIFLFSCENELEDQFNYFNNDVCLRFFPEDINVCLDRIDMISLIPGEKIKQIEIIKEKIFGFLEEKDIGVKNFIPHSTTNNEGIGLIDDLLCELLNVNKIENFRTLLNLRRERQKKKALHKLDIKERKFLEYFAKCPVCGGNNHKSYLLRFYNDNHPTKRSLRESLFELIDKLEDYDSNLNRLGIPCCSCFQRIFGK